MAVHIVAGKINQLIASWEPKIQGAFMQSVQNLRTNAQVKQVASMLQAGNIDGAVAAVGLEAASLRPLDSALTSAFEAGGAFTAKALPMALKGGAKVPFQFDVKGLGAKSWLDTYTSGLVSSILDDQRTMVRRVLQAGVATPKETALSLVGQRGAAGRRGGGLIGLSDAQVKWGQAYRSELTSSNPSQVFQRNLRDKRFDAAVARATSSSQAIPRPLVDKMVMSYLNRALQYRAAGIGLSEAATVVHQGQELAVQQASGAGSVVHGQVGWIWRSAEDGRVRPAHAALDGATARLGEAFQSSLGPIRFPGDPQASAENTINCRCWREPWIAR